MNLIKGVIYKGRRIKIRGCPLYKINKGSRETNYTERRRGNEKENYMAASKLLDGGAVGDILRPESNRGGRGSYADLIKATKTLSDETRLRILNVLSGKYKERRR